MQPKYADYEWRARDGLRLYARRYGPKDTTAAPVICIPGLTRNSRDFEDVAPWIAGMGRRVFAVDLRGRGKSERARDPRSYQPRVYAEDIAIMLRAIDAQRAIFVGTSLGGLVTMTLAARHPRLVAASVLNDVGPKVAKAGVERIRSYVGKTPRVQTWADAAAYAKATNAVAFPDCPEDAWLSFAQRLFRDESGQPVLDYDPRVFSKPSPIVAALAQPLAWGAFKRLAKAGPMLLIYGELTDIIAASTIERMQRVAPHMQRAMVPRVGHAPMLTEPAARHALASFLQAAP